MEHEFLKALFKRDACIACVLKAKVERGLVRRNKNHQLLGECMHELRGKCIEGKLVGEPF